MTALTTSAVPAVLTQTVAALGATARRVCRQLVEAWRRRNDAAVLASAQRVGNLDWALRELAESSDRRLGYRLQFWLQLIFPLIVLAVGALVFLLAVAYFLPLVTLITKLAQ